MPRRQFDTFVFSENVYDQNVPALGFRATTKEQAKLWQRRLRRKLAHLLGGFPEAKCALRPNIAERKSF